MIPLTAQPLTPEAFAPYGEVIATGTTPALTINEGLCQRFSDLATFDIEGGTAGLSLFQSQMRALPYTCNLLERHPLGSQCFIPMSNARLLVIVAPDADGHPGTPEAFVASNSVAVNIARNTWHGVLTPLEGSGLFAVIDRIADAADTRSNLQEHRLDTPFVVTGP